MAPGNRKSAVVQAMSAPLYEAEHAMAEPALGDIVEATALYDIAEGHSVEAKKRAARARAKGDANADPDPIDYTKESVRLVMWSIPGLANVIVWFQNPFVLGIITLGAASLVTWAFWPRRPQPEAAEPIDEEVAG